MLTCHSQLAGLAIEFLDSLRCVLLSTPCLPQKIKSAVGRGHNVHRTVFVQIHSQHSGPHAGAIVDQFRYELRSAWRLRITNGAKPIQDSRAQMDQDRCSFPDERTVSLPTKKSGIPSPSISAIVEPCSSENVTSPAFFVE